MKETSVFWSGWRGGNVFERLEEFCQRQAQSGGDSFDVLKAEVLLTPLDRADVRPVQTGLVGEAFL
jgi:hypothetical protein